jgi:hypothetical protein
MSAQEEFAKELAKQLPVKAIYDDAGSPAAKQSGQLLEDLVKVLQLALAPVQYFAALQDRYRNFLDRSVRRVPEARRVPPSPQILGPVLEGIRYEPEGTPIDEMFSQLLSRSVDGKRVHEAHPAYPILIRQLAPDEAKILAELKAARFDYIFTQAYDAKTALFSGKAVEVDALPRKGLVFPENIPFYLEHLAQLGLAGIYQQGNQEALYDGPPATKQTGIRSRCQYMLTDFGGRFVQACTTDAA